MATNFRTKTDYNSAPVKNNCALFRPPGTVVPGRPYVLLQFFIYFQREISEVREPIAAKFCVMLGSMFYFITPVRKFWGLPPKKNWGGAKNTLILVRFRTPSHYAREYLWNG